MCDANHLRFQFCAVTSLALNFFITKMIFEIFELKSHGKNHCQSIFSKFKIIHRISRVISICAADSTMFLSKLMTFCELNDISQFPEIS